MAAQSRNIQQYVQHVILGINWSFEGILEIVAIVGVLWNHNTHGERSVLDLKKEKNLKPQFVHFEHRKNCFIVTYRCPAIVAHDGEEMEAVVDGATSGQNGPTLQFHAPGTITGLEHKHYDIMQFNCRH